MATSQMDPIDAALVAALAAAVAVANDARGAERFKPAAIAAEAAASIAVVIGKRHYVNLSPMVRVKVVGSEPATSPSGAPLDWLNGRVGTVIGRSPSYNSSLLVVVEGVIHDIHDSHLQPLIQPTRG